MMHAIKKVTFSTWGIGMDYIWFMRATVMQQHHFALFCCKLEVKSPYRRHNV